MKNFVEIKNIVWLDSEQIEWEVTFSPAWSDDTFVAFCHPCKLKIWEKIHVNLEALDADYSETEMEKDTIERKWNWSYDCSGEIVSVKPWILLSHGLYIDIWTKFSNLYLVGSNISCHIDRLDICCWD